MRSRKPGREQVAEVARRRLELLSAELAEIRRDPAGVAVPAGTDGSGEPLVADDDPAADVRVEAPSASPVVPGGRHALRPVAASDRVAGWLHDRLPATLQGRVQLGTSHLTVVAMIVAAALAATAWWVVRADGATTTLPERPAPPPSLVTVSEPPAATSAAPATGPGAPAPSATGMLVIDVAGKVRHPGIARLPVGSRVVDALRAAGGARASVDLSGLNLARLLVDGEQIVVGGPAVPGVAASAASAPGAAPTGPVTLVNLNTADQTQLESLPGVGPVTAQAILEWRGHNGAFTAVDELLEVSGIGDATLAEIAPFVTV
jgi:competence protein ComEA